MLIKGFFLATLLAVVWVSGAHAVSIQYDVTSLGDNRYQYDYTVLNDTLEDGLDGFIIYFDETLYSDLSLMGNPDDWDSLLFQPDLFLPDDGIFDSLALSGPLGLGGKADLVSKR